METQLTQFGSAEQYRPVALYYHESDIVEYVRGDVPTVHRRVDELLTIILDMKTRQPIGFTLKGFRNFYLRHFRQKHEMLEVEFVRLTSILEEAVSLCGDAVFDEKRKKAYKTAHDIAEEDKVSLDDLPQAA